jgi:hypothetical protein
MIGASTADLIFLDAFVGHVRISSVAYLSTISFGPSTETALGGGYQIALASAVLRGIRYVHPLGKCADDSARYSSDRALNPRRLA